MTKKDDEFRRRLLATFKVEAQDHLKTISSGLIELEKMPSPEIQLELIETIYRDSHSLKGAARAVNMTDIENICQSFEGICAAWKKEKLRPTHKLFDTLYRTVDAIRKVLYSFETGEPVISRQQITRLIEDLKDIESSEGVPVAAPESFIASKDLRHLREAVSTSETVRISTVRLNSLLLKAEELLTAKLAAARQTSSIKSLSNMFEALKNEILKINFDVLPSVYRSGDTGIDSMRINYARLHDSFNRSATYMRLIENSIAKLSKSTGLYNKSLERMVDSLLDDMKKAMMMPFSTLLEGFPMLVRNIAHEQGKEVDLVISGEAIEIDKRILDEMKDPLIHIIRNCVDHGIEKPEDRVTAMKQRRGLITIAVSHTNSSKVEIIVSDDGTGIDILKVKEIALKNNLITKEEAEAMTTGEILSLIFESGFSTSPIITDISGRGLGLAIVREKIENLNGSISVESEAFSGTRFSIILPLSIATFRGILVRAADQLFVIPTINVERVVRVRGNDITTVENRETIRLRGIPVSFVRLNSALELPQVKKRSEERGYITAAVVAHGDKQIAFGIDEMLDEQEYLVKDIGKQLERVRNITGAALLGSGQPVPILNVSDLMRSALKVSAPIALVPSEDEARRKKSVLIVEDSITARMLLKNIIESAGYNVKLAVDGIDAITLLKTGEFDLVVSDIEMPRMDGFDLTTKIRSDKKLADMPVVLVTALESREDRERGIDVGANAYMVKSSFNQSNLLEIIGRLI